MTSREMPSSAKLYLQEISRFPVLTKEEERQLFIKAKNGDICAKEKIINCNLKLVVSIAKQYHANHLSFLDIVQEGNIGLMKAYKDFDLSKDYKFSTYATFWIKQAIGNAIKNKNDIIRKPIYLQENINKMNKAIAKLNQNGKTPTAEEIAKEMNVSINEIETMQNTICDTQVISMDKKLGDETEDTIGDLIADTDSKSVEEEIENKIVAKTVASEMKRLLTPREIEVITLRNGLNGGEEETLQAIGDKLGITRERVRQLENTAIKKLRKSEILKQFI